MEKFIKYLSDAISKDNDNCILAEMANVTP